MNLNNSLTLNVGSILEVPISGNSNLVQNSIKAGDTLQLKNFIVGTSSLLDFSGQYTVDFVGTTNSSIYLDVSNNEILTSYGLSSSLPLTFNSNSNYLLANSPYIDLNQGYRYKITRVLQNSEINISSSQSTIQQMYLIQNLSN